jgi:hypothetical protein
MIGAAVVALVFHNGFEPANVGGSVLRPRPFLKLSALHGDVGSRLRRSEDFEKYRVFTVHITALVPGGILCSVRVPALQFEQTTATAEDAPKSVTAAGAST